MLSVSFGAAFKRRRGVYPGCDALAWTLAYVELGRKYKKVDVKTGRASNPPSTSIDTERFG